MQAIPTGQIKGSDYYQKSWFTSKKNQHSIAAQMANNVEYKIRKPCVAYAAYCT